MGREVEFEQIIRQVRGVKSARVVCAGDRICEVHVLANQDRHPKQIVRDIESAVMVRTGLQLDHKKISIAQVEEEETSQGGAGRPRLGEVSVVSRGLEAEARVTLAFGELLIEGTATGPNTAKNGLRLVAVAATRAIEAFIQSPSTKLLVEDVQLQPFAGREVVLVATSMISPYSEAVVIGAAVVKSDPREAAARATLDAFNRKLIFVATN